MRLVPVAAVLTGAATVLLAAGCGGPASAAAPPAPTTSAHAKHGDKAAKGVRGTVTAENGTSWTVTTAKKTTVTVTLTPQTAFGTKAAPATAAQFPVGSQVRVAGARQGDALTATRISAPAHPTAGT